MQEKICIFLRGINVNGIKIKMQDLKAAFLKMGFSEVQTILATGNVVVSLAENTKKRELKAYIEKELSEIFKYEAHILIRSMKELIAIHNSAKVQDVPEEYHFYLLLCDDNQLPLELKHIFDSMLHATNERLIITEQGVFWIVAKGDTLSSEFGSKVLGNKKYKDKLTSRNMNTIEKIIKM